MKRHGNILLLSTHLRISATEPELLIWELKVNFSDKANYQTRGSQIVKIFGFFWETFMKMIEMGNTNKTKYTQHLFPNYCVI